MCDVTVWNEHVHVTVSITRAYLGRSAISLTSATTILCSSSRCLRSASLCARGVDSEQNRHTSGGSVLAAEGSSGKHSGSRMLS